MLVKRNKTYKTKNIETPWFHIASEFVENAVQDCIHELAADYLQSQSIFSSAFRKVFNGNLVTEHLHDDEDVSEDDILNKLFYIDGEESE